MHFSFYTIQLLWLECTFFSFFLLEAQILNCRSPPESKERRPPPGGIGGAAGKAQSHISWVWQLFNGDNTWRLPTRYCRSKSLNSSLLGLLTKMLHWSHLQIIVTRWRLSINCTVDAFDLLTPTINNKIILI